MKFHQLNVNEHFTIEGHDNCTFIKVRAVGGTCCTPAHNAKMVCYTGKVPKEQPVQLDDETEVVVIVKNIQSEENVVPPQPYEETRVGYKWHGEQPDPTTSNLKGGGDFSGKKNGDNQ